MRTVKETAQKAVIAVYGTVVDIASLIWWFG